MARILFFGPLKDISGQAERALTLPASVQSLAALIDFIEAQDAELGTALRAPAVRVIVNQNIVARDESLSDSDEIAFLPPFSGG